MYAEYLSIFPFFMLFVFVTLHVQLVIFFYRYTTIDKVLLLLLLCYGRRGGVYIYNSK